MCILGKDHRKLRKIWHMNNKHHAKAEENMINSIYFCTYLSLLVQLLYGMCQHINVTLYHKLLHGIMPCCLERHQ